MIGLLKKNMDKLVYGGLVLLVLAHGAKEAKAGTAFKNIRVTTGGWNETSPAIWGNFIVWKGAYNEAYDIEQQKMVEMPGLIIDGVPAIWDNKVVWSGANGYYDIDSRQMVYPAGLSVGDWPAIHDNKIVWSDSTGYYDLNLQEMVYPPGLSIGYDPDVFEDKIVWENSEGYYDTALQTKVYPEGLIIDIWPAIYKNKIVWARSTVYYDIDLQEMMFMYSKWSGYTIAPENPDIFEDTIVGHNYDAYPPISTNIYIWDPVCKRRMVAGSGTAYAAKIYNDIVVWTDKRNGNADIYMAQIPEACCGDPDHPYPVGDLNRDCRVDLLDLAILSSHWLEDSNP